MQQQHEAHIARLEQLLSSVSHTKDIRARSTLHKFYKNCREIYTKMDKEMVHCRRRNKLTQKYTELEVEFTEAVNTFEQWAVMAALMY
jgi:uncharacterized coiled-coil DUF342 family protein